MKRPARGLLGMVLAATALLAAGGCATSTPYQPLSASSAASGGYTDQRLGEGRYRVTFAGNRLTTRERVESYLLFRAAELTIEQGYDWFVVVDHEMDHEIERQVRPDPHYEPWYGPQYGDWRPYWRYQGPGSGWRDWDPYHGDPFWTRDVDVMTIERFEATSEIRLGRGPIPAGEETAMLAREVIAGIGPKVEYPHD
jgi:hypothetical protein